MKKLTLLAVAALALASCTNDDLVMPEKGGNDQNLAMTFGIRSANMSRDGKAGDPGTPALTGLETYFNNFGVFAYKGSDATGKILASEFVNDNRVMSNFLVGYYNAGVGGYDYTYNDANTAAYHENSLWWYDLLGSAQYTGAAPYETSSISVNPTQFLKYWDNASKYTYFFCTAPYNADAALTCTTDGQAALAFNKYTPAGLLSTDKTDGDYNFFAMVATPKANYGNEVEPLFVRIGSKMQVAFYEQINGYSVKVKSVQATPMKDDGATPGQILFTCKPTVTFATDNTDVAANYTLSATNVSARTTAISFPMPAATAIGDSKANATFATRDYRVLPVALDAATTYDGLLFTINYDLIADDTLEVTNITANVMVYATYCQWLNNSLYKYYFRITTNGLNPIIFDNCKVANYENPTDWETLWDVTEDPANPNPQTL